MRRRSVKPRIVRLNGGSSYSGAEALRSAKPVAARPTSARARGELSRGESRPSSAKPTSTRSQRSARPSSKHSSDDGSRVRVRVKKHRRKVSRSRKEGAPASPSGPAHQSRSHSAKRHSQDDRTTDGGHTSGWSSAGRRRRVRKDAVTVYPGNASDSRQSRFSAVSDKPRDNNSQGSEGSHRGHWRRRRRDETSQQSVQPVYVMAEGSNFMGDSHTRALEAKSAQLQAQLDRRERKMQKALRKREEEMEQRLSMREQALLEREKTLNQLLSNVGSSNMSALATPPRPRRASRRKSRKSSSSDSSVPSESSSPADHTTQHPYTSMTESSPSHEDPGWEQVRNRPSSAKPSQAGKASSTGKGKSKASGKGRASGKGKGKSSSKKGKATGKAMIKESHRERSKIARRLAGSEEQQESSSSGTPDDDEDAPSSVSPRESRPASKGPRDTKYESDFIVADSLRQTNRGFGQGFDELVKRLDVPRERVEKWRDSFNTFNVNATGMITAHELREVMRNLGTTASAADVHELMEMADADVRKGLTFAQFCNLMVAAERLQMKLIYHAFRVFDLDNTGYIDEDELFTAMQRLGRRTDKTKVHELFDRGDTNHDGKISLEEFAHILGFEGKVTDEFSSSSSSSLDSDSSMGLSDFNDERSGSDAMRVTTGKITVTVKAFYWDQSITIKTHGSSSLEDFVEALSERVDHPADKLKLYYHGKRMTDPEKSLAQYHVNMFEPIYLIIVPSGKFLSHTECFNEQKLPHLGNIFYHFLREGVLRPVDALTIIRRARAIMETEPNVIHVDDPVTVVGDLHGQFYDLDTILTLGGPFSTESNYVFIGDFVDRGSFSCETILFLLAAKMKFPKNVILLRGNHECRFATGEYGTKAEVMSKYDNRIYKALMTCFDCMPLAAVVHSADKKFLMIHGGLSPDLPTLESINEIDRFCEPPQRGPLKDVLWTDPYDDNVIAVNFETGEELEPHGKVWKLDNLGEKDGKVPKSYKKEYFFPNERSKNFPSYGHQAVCKFLADNDLVSVFRGHEQKRYGYELYADGPKYDFPGVVTIFSAPNYTDMSMNDGAIAVFRDGVLEFVTYPWRLHPFYRSWNDEYSSAEGGEKDQLKEDFLQFVNYLHPESLLKLPVDKLLEEYNVMFAAHAARTQEASTEDGSQEEDQWHFVQSHLGNIVQLSADPRVRKRFRKKSKAMLLWYDTYDHFAEAKKAEVHFEKDFTVDGFMGETEINELNDSAVFMRPDDAQSDSLAFSSAAEEDDDQSLEAPKRRWPWSRNKDKGSKEGKASKETKSDKESKAKASGKKASKKKATKKGKEAAESSSASSAAEASSAGSSSGLL